MVPKKGRLPGMKIFHRHHFSSALKRMCVVAGRTQNAGSSETTFFASVKGAPETVKTMLASVPPRYEETYLKLSRRGARVLALAFKELGTMTHQKV